MSVSGVVAGRRRIPLKVTGRLMASLTSNLPVKVSVVGMRVRISHFVRFTVAVGTLTALGLLSASCVGFVGL